MNTEAKQSFASLALPKITLQASRQERKRDPLSPKRKLFENNETSIWNDVLFAENTSRNTVDGVE